jgi:hypothetical protein
VFETSGRLPFYEQEEFVRIVELFLDGRPLRWPSPLPIRGIARPIDYASRRSSLRYPFLQEKPFVHAGRPAFPCDRHWREYRHVQCRERTKTNRSRTAMVGTTEKSAETKLCMWFFRNVRQFCDGGLRCRIRYLGTVFENALVLPEPGT